MYVTETGEKERTDLRRFAAWMAARIRVGWVGRPIASGEDRGWHEGCIGDGIPRGGEEWCRTAVG
jgi:hypothetical protein